MSPSWSETLHVLVRDDCLHVAATSWGRVRWQERLPIAANGPERTLTLLAARHALPRRWALQVAGWQALHAVVPWQSSTATPSAWHAVARETLALRHGLDADALLVGVVQQPYGQSRPAWAVARPWLEQWLQLAQQHQAAIVSLNSSLLTWLPPLTSRLCQDGLVLVVEPGLVHVGVRQQGKWQDLSARPLSPTTEQLAALARQEQALRLLDDGAVQVVQPFTAMPVPSSFQLLPTQPPRWRRSILHALAQEVRP